MEMNELSVLARKYLSGAASEAEKAALLRWYNAYDESELMVHITAAEEESEATLEARMLQRLQQATGTAPVTKVHFLRRRSTWAAAAILLAMVAGAWFLWHSAGIQQEFKTVAQAKPGNKAVLVLDDGTQLQLDSTGQGVLSQQGNATVVQAAGSLAYQPGKPENTNAPLRYNTLRTPRGGQFKVVLPDGSGVWLNAASSITYPTAFTGKERKVSITGEAYFEVAASAQQPFIVQAMNMDVLVLGTHFNVNAYEDESSINTTLLEGAVGIRVGDQAQHILPGQQMRVTGTHMELVKHADIAAITAWKNGYFSFKDADVPAIMRQLARWYDVKVHYEGKIPDGDFSGEIGRSLTLEQVAALLEATRIHIRITNGGRDITVVP
ncbi:FecR family protein [Chitinophaga vietnamensis]|uniref:FecR family protein n=1 Tax=Chitinophaga vietnamensis TaxID=2593957 RepID=UPI001177B236|nr:FecR family protein [Chitinophaga vietnamensis]